MGFGRANGAAYDALVARRKCVEGFTQIDIAERMRISTRSVSRLAREIIHLLNEAGDTGLPYQGW